MGPHVWTSRPQAIFHSLLQIGDFLDVLDLARCEQANIFSDHPLILQGGWEAAASRKLNNLLLWPSARYVIEQFKEEGYTGKSLICELRLLERAVFPHKAWRPWITETSFCSVKALPSLPSSDEASATSDEMNRRQYDGAFGPPYQASVAVSRGAYRGQPLVVGVKIGSIGIVEDAFCIGVEAIQDVESGNGWCLGIQVSLLFAPFSGKCYIQTGVYGPWIDTQMLPTLHAAPELCAWAQVTENGSIRFLRQVLGCELEETDSLGPECCFFPQSVDEYYVHMHLWPSDLKAPLNVSVEYCGTSFPCGMNVSELEDGLPPEMEIV